MRALEHEHARTRELVCLVQDVLLYPLDVSVALCATVFARAHTVGAVHVSHTHAHALCRIPLKRAPMDSARFALHADVHSDRSPPQ